MNCKEYIDTKSGIIDSFLLNYFKQECKPVVLQEAMLYSLFAGGKRLRPVLALASYEACGGYAEDIVPYAATLELVHTYSLIHDDLPSMDNDDFRRGKPTNHKVYGEAIAILAGDALLTEAFSILSGTPRPSNIKDKRIIEMIQEISAAAGVNGMVAGQVQDILSENKQPDGQALEFIHTRKTAALIRASVQLGPILCDSNREVRAALSHYGNSVGLAFQIIDDILDIEGNPEDLGKPVGSDERINKMTYPRVYGMEKSREIAEQLISEGISSLSAFSSDADPLREIARYLLIRKN